MASEAYEEIGGSPVVERRWPRSYDEGFAITRSCPPVLEGGCGANAFTVCHRPDNGKARPMPCVVRITGRIASAA